jgi:hypothetical protein
MQQKPAKGTTGAHLTGPVEVISPHDTATEVLEAVGLLHRWPADWQGRARP